MELIEKITSYNIFTNLLPGAVFAYCADRYFGTGFASDDLLIAIFVYYFLGVVTNRIGSLIVEPVLIKIGLLKQGVYKEYLIASKLDQKIEVLLESRNMYRTFAAMFLLLLVVGAYTTFKRHFPALNAFRGAIVAVVLGTLFIAAYVKQSAYISRRIKDRDIEDE